MISIANPDAFRQQVREHILPKYITLPLPLPEIGKIITNLEIGIFNYAVKEARFRKLIKKWSNHAFVQVYLDRLRSIVYNLKYSLLLQSILQNEIAVEGVADMNHQEFMPSKWQPLIQKNLMKEESKFTNSLEASTDMFTCRKCKSKRCTYYEMQTRSADEPATIFVTCLDCGKHWKA